MKVAILVEDDCEMLKFDYLLVSVYKWCLNQSYLLF